MVSHELTARAAKGLLHRRDLQQNVGAVAFRLDHILQAAHLALDARETFEHGSLDRRIDSGRFASGLTGAGGVGERFGLRFAGRHLA